MIHGLFRLLDDRSILFNVEWLLICCMYRSVSWPACDTLVMTSVFYGK